MLIHRMAASFGRLQNHTLELKDGLNIIQAPNESGKSTWCAFLLSMLYGINSRERDRSGFVADKNRYAPWSGLPMAGRIDCRWEDRDVTLMRATRRQAAPMGEFRAIYAGTGDLVPDLTGQTCGETLLGITREVFERSAFIRQAGLAITQDAGLERRIASLITSGQEDTSYTEAAAALKAQLNRRRHNKTGQLPQLEAQLSDARRQLEETRSLSEPLRQARRQEERLSRQEASLEQELSLHDRWEAQQKRQSLADAEDAAAQAGQKAEAIRCQLARERIPENDTISRLRGAIVNLETTRKSVDKARSQRDEAMKALLRAEAAASKSPFAGQTAESAQREASRQPPKQRTPLNLLILALIWLAGALVKFFYPAFLPAVQPPVFWAAWSCAALAAAGTMFFLARRKATAWRAAHRKRFGTDDQAEISALADTYVKLLEARDAAQAELNAKSATADALYNSLTSNEQGILLEVRRFAPTAYDIPTADALLRLCAQRRQELTRAEAAGREAALRRDLLRQQLPAETDAAPAAAPTGSREEVQARLEQVRAALHDIRSAADRLAGQLHVLGDPAVLESSIQAMEAEQARLEGEFQSLRLALDTLDSANTALQSRFSPALGRRAAEIFSQLTEGRYSGVVLDRSLHVGAEPTGDSVYRDAALLSAGAADQLYLAVRLAICDLVLPAEKQVPIILDDALANFDDSRCAAALRYLKEAAKTRQILLFTCHSREADFFSGDGEVFIQQLTESPRQV